MKKLFILALVVVALGAIYMWGLPLIGINTSIQNDPYENIAKERERILNAYPQARNNPTTKKDELGVEPQNTFNPVQIGETPLVGFGGHKASGKVAVIGLDAGYHAIKYSDISFESNPGLHVYLTKNLTIHSEAVDIGPISSTQKTSFYRVLPSVNIKRYKYIVVASSDKKEIYNYAEILIK